MKSDRRAELDPAPSTLFDRTARWFNRAKAALLDDLPCSKGCCHCCVGVFPVTLLDRQEIQRGLRALSAEARQGIVQRALDQARLMEREVPELAGDRFIDGWLDGDMDALIERYGELPCPALQSDGSCGVYAFRPLTCRSMGIPSEADGLVHAACDVQTAVPIVRLSRALRQEEDRLVAEEAEQLACLRQATGTVGEELLSPYAFVPDIGGETTTGVV